jgi:hypothetical protein
LIELGKLTSKGKIAARKLIHVQILLLADEKGERTSLKDADIANNTFAKIENRSY